MLLTKKTTFLAIMISCISSITFAMDTKHRAEHSPSIPITDVKSTAESRSTIAANLHDQKKKKSNFALVQPIIPLNMDPKEKISLFRSRVHEKDTMDLYRLAHDPVIKQYIKDKKIFQELRLHCITDSADKTIVKHAIENNDAPFVIQFLKLFDNKLRFKMMRYAAQQEKPRVFRALLSAHASDMPEKQLDELDIYFSTLPSLNEHELSSYNEARVMLVEQRKNYATAIMKIAAAFTKKLHSTVNPAEQLDTVPKDVCGLISKMLQPTIEISYNSLVTTIMHPDLEAAIVQGNTKRFNELVNAGWPTADCNKQGFNAVELAVYSGQPEMLEKLLAKTPYLDKTQRKKLICIAERQKAAVRENSHNDSKESQEKYDTIISFIKFTLPITTLQKNIKLWKVDRRAFHPDQAGLFLDCLKRGANPNAQDRSRNPIAFHSIRCSFNDTHRFLKMLLDHGANVNAIAKDRGKRRPLLYWAVFYNREMAATLLLDAGANPNMHAYGDPIAVLTLNNNNNNPSLLEKLLNKGANPNARVKDDRGKEYSFLGLAKIFGGPIHTQLLIEAGARDTTS